MTTRYSFLVLMAVFIFLGPAEVTNGQDRDDQWDRLLSLSPGTTLIVDQERRKAAKGAFVRTNSQALTLRSNGREFDLARDTVSAVYLGRRSSRFKRGIIGALAGAGAGMLIGVVGVVATKGHPLIAAGGILIGIPAGAAIGAATGGGTKKGELIYRN